MNDKIKELALQAGFTEEDDGDLAVWDGMEAAGCTEELKKFAELIVRECIEKIEVEMDFAGDANDFNTQDTLDILRDEIKDHFGLK